MDSRWIPLDGVENIRDLGGLTNKQGETLATGQFYRGATFHTISSKGLGEAKKRSISTIVDLRSRVEESARPNSAISEAGLKLVNVPMLDHMQSTMASELADFPTTMTGLYYELLSHYEKEFARVIKILARTEGGTVFHCAVGKDRTGLVSMFLLSIGGVAQESIAEDYALSKPLNGQNPKDLPGLPSFIFKAKPEWMYETLDWIKKEYESPIKYLLNAGATREELEMIRRKFNVSLQLEG